VNAESGGARLKKMRLEKGITLEEVQKKTKIHLNVLQALEGDGLTNLNPVYLKGFLKIYCKFLGVEPKDYIPDYKETQEVDRIIKKEEIPRRLREPILILKKIKKPFVFILVIIFVWLGLFNLGKRQAPAKVRQKPKGLQTAIPQKKTVSIIQLSIRTRENCWISLKVDGRVVFQRVLEKGRFESWQAKEKMELSLGNAGAVELEVNGQRFLNLGRRGKELKNIVITKEGLNIPR
jgi:cytoskeletal protein RodZ